MTDEPHFEEQQRIMAKLIQLGLASRIFANAGAVTSFECGGPMPWKSNRKPLYWNKARRIAAGEKWQEVFGVRSL